MSHRTLVSFDYFPPVSENASRTEDMSLSWATKKLLRQKANFVILEGFLSELLHQDIKVNKIIESESNQTDEDDKYNVVDLLCGDMRGELIII